jgi:hypothetical protein
MRTCELATGVGVIVLGLVAGAPAYAGADVCEDPGEQSFAAVAFVNHERSPVSGRVGTTNQQNQNLDLMFASDAGLSWGFAHRYLIFDFSGIEPQTNAHLHTSFVPLHWRFHGRRSLRLSVAPALSASSNVMGHPREYESDTPQLLVALVAGKQLSEHLTVDYGLCGDHRFGEYRLYPVVGIDWRPEPDWTFELGFPTSRIRYDIDDSLSSALQIAPDGNEWHVEDRDFTAGSQFLYEAVALEWVTQWRFRPELTIELSLGRQVHNRFEMTLEDGERVSLSGDPANRIGVGLRWRF